MILRSPATGRPLHADTPHSLADGAGERWPVVDGIPYLRTESEGLVAVALDNLDADCPDDALVALLTDQDGWWTGPATDLTELMRLVRERDTLSLREAMALLRMGPVADYFAYRWSDPTYLAGLALVEAHWSEPATAFELACGIGHYLRELTSRGVACTGADVVFSKCWLAKHWVAPEADYVVFDAAAPWPIGGARFDLVMCHDAFYFLPEQARNAERLRGAVSPGGTLAISRVHNGEYHAGVKRPPMTADSCSELFPEATVYSEDDLYWSLVRADRPWPHDWNTIDRLETKAFSMIEGGPPEPRQVAGGVAMPLPSAKLRPNPLLGPDGARWPSQRYGAEYGENSLWAFKEDELEPRDWIDPVRLRRLVDLPERW